MQQLLGSLLAPPLDHAHAAADTGSIRLLSSIHQVCHHVTQVTGP